MITTVTLNPALDKTIYVDRIHLNDSNRISKIEIDAGGKGINCSRMVKELGGETRVIAFLGGKTGDYIESVLRGEDIPLHRIKTKAETRTCTAVEEEANVPPTTFNECGGPVEPYEWPQLVMAVKVLAGSIDYLVMGGSVPQRLPLSCYRTLCELAAECGSKAVVDSDGPCLMEALKAKPFMIKPNIDEARRLLGRELLTKEDIAEAARELGEIVELAVISMGKNGAIAAYDGDVYEVLSPQVKAVSTIGSGDSMVAGILVSLERGWDITEALRLGAAAGAATAMSDGTDIGTRENAERLLSGANVCRV